MEDTVSLKEHFKEILSEKEKNLQNVLASAKEAVAVAEKNAEKWRDNANEWRAAMNDREKTFVHQGEFDAYKESTEKAIQAEKTRRDRGEGKDDAITKYAGYVIAIIAIIVSYLIN